MLCWCHTLQVLSPTLAAKVDVAALWLLDLPSLVALALGVLAEEFGWIAKSFPQAFSVSAGCSLIQGATVNSTRNRTDQPLDHCVYVTSSMSFLVPLTGTSSSVCCHFTNCHATSPNVQWYANMLLYLGLSVRAAHTEG